MQTQMALVSSHHATSQLDRYERPPKTTPQTAEAPPKYFETFRGFCKNKHDAQILVEACVAGYLFPLNVIPVDLSAMRLQSGTIIVFAESTSHTQMMRWRDGCRWSPSRVNGQFLLYREVESTKKPPSTAIVEESTRFNTPVPRPNTRLVPHGFAKRTISVQGSNGQNYRVISYFYPKDIAHLYGDDEESDDTPVNLKRHDRLDIQVEPLKTPSQFPNLIKYSPRFRQRLEQQLSQTSNAPSHHHQQPSPLPPIQQSLALSARPSYQQHSHHNTLNNACPCGGLGKRKWSDFNDDWFSGRPTLRPLHRFL